MTSGPNAAPLQRLQPGAARAAAALLLAWAALTALFWVGYVGSDDLFYARYAYLLHRPPINWWEFRMPYVLVLHGSFAVFGPGELAAALPTLLASVGLAASVASLAWGSGRGWTIWAAVALAISMPIDVGFRTVPGAPYFAAGLLALGTACVFKQAGWVRLLGAALLAGAFATHEVAFFHVAIFCLTALAYDARRFALPVLVCVALSGLTLAIECAAYDRVLGDPFARYRTAAHTTSDLPVGYDPDTGVRGAAFYVWPLRNLVLSKPFACDLAVLLTAGLVAFKRLQVDQRILCVTTLLVFLWLGFGTQVPWAYKPFYRQFHYYAPLTLGVASLLPAVLTEATGRGRLAGAAVGFCLLGHLMALGMGGRWGQRVDVSRGLLSYAESRPQSWFVTDVATLNEMYVIGGFRLPENVVCLNGPAVERHLIVNKEPAGHPSWRFPDRRADAILLNLEGAWETAPEAEFSSELARYSRLERRVVVPPKLRGIFRPLAWLAGSAQPLNAMVQSLGGAVIELP